MIKTMSFGTDGIRGHADHFPFDDQTLNHLGSAIARWATEKYGVVQPKLLIGHDTRISCERIKTSLCTGLASLPCTLVDAGIIPTPGVMHLIKEDNSYHCGIVISASHNPYYDNGIKVFDARGKLQKHDENSIVAWYSHYAQLPQLLPSPHSSITRLPEAAAHYLTLLTRTVPAHYLNGKKIVLDCAQGATAQLAQQLFESLGASVIPLYDSPNGTNINENCGAVHPEHLQQAVLANQADVGFAFDGDGDRVVAVNKQGIIKDGDDFLVILMSHPHYAHSTGVVGTIMTNQGAVTFCNAHGKNLIRAQVGEKHIVHELESHQLELGSEPSGHIIIRSILNSGDGMLAALHLLVAATTTDNWALTSFSKFPHSMVNVSIAHKNDLAQEPYASLIKEYESHLHGGRMIVRYSGTENKLRVMVEDESYEHAHSTATTLAHKLQSLLS